MTDDDGWDLVGAWLTERVAELKLSMAELQRASGISFKTLQGYMEGKPIRRVDKQRALALALGVYPDAFDRIRSGLQPRPLRPPSEEPGLFDLTSGRGERIWITEGATGVTRVISIEDEIVRTLAPLIAEGGVEAAEQYLRDALRTLDELAERVGGELPTSDPEQRPVQLDNARVIQRIWEEVARLRAEHLRGGGNVRELHPDRPLRQAANTGDTSDPLDVPKHNRPSPPVGSDEG